MREVSRSAVALAAAGLLVLAGCGEKRETTTGAAVSSGAPAGTVNVAESEFKLTPSSAKVPKAGVVEIHVTNRGKIKHALAIDAPGAAASTAPIAPGGTATLKADLKPGTYTWFCPIDGHRGKGMSGQVVVAGGGSGGAPGPSGSGGSSSGGRGGY